MAWPGLLLHGLSCLSVILCGCPSAFPFPSFFFSLPLPKCLWTLAKKSEQGLKIELSTTKERERGGKNGS